MGNPCICHTTGAISSQNAPTSRRLHTPNLSLDLSRRHSKLQKQQNFPLTNSSRNAINQRRRKNPKTFVVHSSSSEHVHALVDAASGSNVLTPIVHSITSSAHQSIPFISSLATQIATKSEALLNHITAQFAQGTLHESIDQILHQFAGGTLHESVDGILHALSIAFGNPSPIAPLGSPAIQVAAIFVTLTGSAVALRSSESRKDFPLSLSKLDIVKARLVKLQKHWSTTAKEEDVQRETAQSAEDAEEVLPLQYDTEAISNYYKKRPFLVFSRASFILLECSILLVNILMDNALGKANQNERLRASQLVESITRLGPTAVKVGQALSIRPDLLPPTYLEELQKLQDNVPPFSNEEARRLVSAGLGLAVEDVYSEFSEEPIAAASLGQVYKAKLRDSGETVAVKVQRPNALGTICLDLYIIRALAMGLRKLPNHNSFDLLSFIDHWANHFFQELDYTQEAKNAEQFSKDMRSLPNVVVTKPLTQYTTRKVLTTSWVQGEKLSESKETDVPQLVSVALNCYLIQLLETGFLHADPHPGNLLRTPDGRVCMLGFGLMIQVTEEQRYALIDYISHLMNSDYEKVADDLIKLGFLPPHLVNNKLAIEILPQLSRVLSQLVKGGGLQQQMDFDEIIADLTQMATEHSIVIPPYFAMILQAFSILEGIGLKTNPNYVIIDECYPYICKRLLTDNSSRARTALKYFLFGKKAQLDARRVETILLGFQNFRKTMMPTNGTRNSQPMVRQIDPTSQQVLDSLFAPEGSFLQELLLAELVRVVDALSREAVYELWNTFVGIALPLSRFIPPPFSLPISGFFGMGPLYTLSEEDQEALSLVRRLGRLLGSEMNKQTVAEMTAATHSVTALFPDFSTGLATASTRFLLMLLHRKALRFADDLDGRNSLVYWNRDPAASARHVRPLVLLAPPKDRNAY